MILSAIAIGCVPQTPTTLYGEIDDDNTTDLSDDETDSANLRGDELDNYRRITAEGQDGMTLALPAAMTIDMTDVVVEKIDSKNFEKMTDDFGADIIMPGPMDILFSYRVLIGNGDQPTTFDNVDVEFALPASALPASALPASALPASALPASALPASALPASAIPLEAMPSSALPASALPASALPALALPASALPASALPAPGLPASALPAAFFLRSNGITGHAADRPIHYLVQNAGGQSNDSSDDRQAPTLYVSTIGVVKAKDGSTMALQCRITSDLDSLTADGLSFACPINGVFDSLEIAAIAVVGTSQELFEMRVNGLPLLWLMQKIDTSDKPNQAPSITNETAYTIVAGKTNLLDLSASDPDQDYLLASITGLPGFASRDFHHLLFRPVSSEIGKEYPLTVTVEDGGNPRLKTMATIRILVVADGTAQPGLAQTVISSTQQLLSGENEATFVFANPLALSYECLLDASGFKPCSSPSTYQSLGDGAHQFFVKAYGANGIVTGETARYLWTIDTTAPQTTITRDLAPLTEETEATFNIIAEPGVTLNCLLDDKPLVDCNQTVVLSDLTDGAHSFSVSATDLVGNVELEPPVVFWTIDTTPPVSTIVTGPAALSAGSDAVFEFGADGPGATFNCSLDDAAFASCLSRTQFSNLADGSHRLAVKATDQLGRIEKTPVVFNWTIDTRAPQTTIQTRPDSVVASNFARFEFNADENNLTFLCSLDESVTTVCISPVVYPILTEGTHIFKLKARDATGNEQITASVVAWEIDITPPGSGSLSIFDSNGTTNDKNPRIDIVSDNAEYMRLALSEAALSTTPWMTVAATYNGVDISAAEEGSVTIYVEFKDVAGNIQPTHASDSTIYDVSGPITMFTTTPPEVDRSVSGQISFASEPNTQFACNLDSDGFVDCSSPFVYSLLPDGVHRIEVTATDRVGNTGQSESLSWTIDTTPPLPGSIAIDDHLGYTNDMTPILTIDAIGASFMRFALSEAGLSLNEWIPYSSTYEAFDLSVGGDGQKTIYLELQDEAGNIQTNHSSASTVYDSVVPTIGNIVISDNSGYTNDAAPSLTISSVGADYMRLALSENGIPDAAWIAFSPTIADFDISLGGEGQKTILIEFSDLAGNVQVSHANDTTTYDITGPTVAFVNAPPSADNNGSGQFSFSSEAGAFFACNLDNVGFSPCTSPYVYQTLGQNGHTFAVRASDSAGNIGQATNFTWSIDTTAPNTGTIAISDNNGYTNDATPTLTLTSSGASFMRLALVEAALSSATWVPFGATFEGFDISAGGDGSKTVFVEFKDGAGNIQPSHAGATTTYDTVVPGSGSIVINDNDGYTNDPKPDLTIGSVGAGFMRIAGSENAIAAASWLVYSPSYSGFDISAGGDGTKTIFIEFKDLAGNIQPLHSSATTTYDTVGPAVILTEVPSSIDGNSDGHFSFAAEIGATFRCRLDGMPPFACSSPWQYLGLADDQHVFSATAIDLAGNAGPESPSYLWKIDTQPPLSGYIQIQDTDGYIKNAKPEIFFSSVGATFMRLAMSESELATAAWRPYSGAISDLDISSGGEGSKTVYVEFKDDAGNVRPDHPFDSTYYDPNPPSTGSIAIIDNLGYTNDNTPMLNLSSDGAASMRLALSETSLTLALWLPYATSFENMNIATGGDGMKTIFVEFKDRAGNIQPVHAFDSTTYDTVGPASNLVDVPPALDNSSDGIFSFVSEPGVSFLCYLDGLSAPLCLSPFYYSGLLDGLHSFSVQGFDLAGNAGTTTTAHTWTIDTAPPTNGSITVADNAGFTNQPTPALSISSDGAAFMRLAMSEAGLNQVSWLPFTTLFLSFDISAGGDGPKTIWVEYKDEAGNIQPDHVSATTTFDTLPPAVGTVTVTDNSGFTNDPKPDLVIAAAGADYMHLASTEAGLATAPWLTFTTSYGNMDIGPGGDGLKTIFVEFKDLAGNIQLVHASDTTIFDTVGPATTLSDVPPSPDPNSDVTFSFSSEPDTAFKCTVDGFTPQVCPSPISYSDLPDGLHSFSVHGIDLAGNSGPSTETYYWTIDTTPPTTGSIAIADNAGFTNQATPVLSISSEGATYMRLALSEAWLDQVSWLPFTTTLLSFDLSAGGEGLKTVFVEFRDDAGNVQPVHATDSTTYDTTPPANRFLLIDDGDQTTDNLALSLTLGADDGNGVTGYCIGVGDVTPDAADPCWAEVTVDTSFYAQIAYTASANGAPFIRPVTIKAWFRDQAGNASGPASDSIAYIDPAGFVGLPGAISYLGAQAGDALAPNYDMSADSNEYPAHLVTLSSFKMQLTEVTAAEYEVCVDFGACAYTGTAAGNEITWQYPGRQDYPINNVTWYEAETFCAWVGGRLPTEAQHEYAARGGDGRRFPWGDTAYNNRFNFLQSGDPFDDGPTSATYYDGSLRGTYQTGDGRSPFAIFDLAGNVLEWTADWWGSYTSDAAVDPSGPASGPSKVVRGGSWLNPAAAGRVSYRGGAFQDMQTSTIGFRCVRPSGPTIKEHNLPQVNVFTINGGDVSTDNATVTVQIKASDDTGLVGYCLKENPDRPTLADSCWRQVEVSSDFSTVTSYTLSPGQGTKTLNLWFLDISENGSVRSSASIELALPPNAGGFRTIAAGFYHSCALTYSNSLFCWGENGVGQLGLGDANTRSVPTQVGAENDWFALTVGGIHTCALKSDGRLFCWGYNSDGQLGLGDTVTQYNPVLVGSDSDWTALDSGFYHTCALKSDGRLFCWGDNYDGQLGVSDTTDRNSPAPVGLANDWSAMAIGGYHSCAQKNDGRLFCWGNNGAGQLGQGDTTYRSTPTQVGSEASWLKPAAGAFHTCAIKNIGNLYCWGYNVAGQLGQGDTSDRYSPNVVGLDSDWAFLSAGSIFTCAGKTNGQLFCWGENVSGQLGQGDTNRRYIPALVMVGTAWRTVALGDSHVIGLASDGRVFAWGINSSRQLGLGDTDDRYSPTELSGWGSGPEAYDMLAAGAEHTCAIKTDGRLFCWGWNSYGELGQGDTIDRNLPTQVGIESDWQGLDLGGLHTCARKSDSRLFCWGNNGNGQLGQSDTTRRLTPTQVGSESDWQSLKLGNYHTCALKTDGRLFCWGSNGFGQLGLADTNDRLTPTQVGADIDWQHLDAGTRHTCALKSDGRLFCWGDNSVGQLGLGDTTDRLTPTQVGSDGDWRDLDLGYFHTCALKTDGRLFCWGDNYSGPLGLGDTTDRLTPTQVGSESDWPDLALGYAHTCARKTDGRLFCWGDNYYGQLGLGDTIDRSTPTQVGSDPDWQTLASGRYHTCAKKSDDRLFCWGRNFSGQLGLGDTTDRLVPVEITGW